MTGGKVPPTRPLISWQGSPTAPMSPEAATTVTWWSAALLRCRMQGGQLGMGVAVLASGLAGGADRDDTSERCPDPQGSHGGCHSIGGVVEGRPLHQDFDDGGPRGDGVHHLGIQHLFSIGQPGRCRRRKRADDPDSSCGQVEQLVELREISADVAGRKRELRLGQLGQHDGLAAAVGSVFEQRRDAVRRLELTRRVTRGEGIAVTGRRHGLGSGGSIQAGRHSQTADRRHSRPPGTGSCLRRVAAGSASGPVRRWEAGRGSSARRESACSG